MKMLVVEVGIDDKTKMEGYREGVCLVFIGRSGPLVSMDADCADRQILDAVRSRQPDLTIHFRSKAGPHWLKLCWRM